MSKVSKNRVSVDDLSDDDLVSAEIERLNPLTRIGIFERKNNRKLLKLRGSSCSALHQIKDLADPLDPDFKTEIKQKGANTSKIDNGNYRGLTAFSFSKHMVDDRLSAEKSLYQAS